VGIVKLSLDERIMDRLEKFYDRTAESHAFEAWWRGLAKGPDGLPPRAAIKPGQIVKWLASLLILEDGGDGTWPVRLAGTALYQRFGVEITGRDYCSLMPETYRPRTLAGLREIVDRPAGRWSITEVTYDQGTYRLAEGTGFPVTGGPGQGRQVVILTIGRELRLEGQPVAPGLLISATQLRSQWIDIGAGLPDA